MNKDFVDNGIKYTINTDDSTNTFSSSVPASSTSENPVKLKLVRHLPWTSEWVVQRIKCDAIESSLAVLKSWVPAS